MSGIQFCMLFERNFSLLSHLALETHSGLVRGVVKPLHDLGVIPWRLKYDPSPIRLGK